MKWIVISASIVLVATLAGCGSAASPSPAPSTAIVSNTDAPSPSALASTSSAASPAAPSQSASPGASASADANVITLTEWKVAIPSTMKAGKVTFTINNAGAATHELIAFRSDLAPVSFPMANGDVNEDGKGIVQVTDGDDIPAGGTQARTIDLTKPGTYVFLCNIPGHFHQGMYAAVTVTK